MSSSFVPSALPEPPAQRDPPAPELLRADPKKPRGNRRWLTLVLSVAALALFLWFASRRTGEGTSAQESGSLRTATVRTGDLEQTIRVSGIVSAERFAALMAPRLRGSRVASGSYGQGRSLVTSSTSTPSTPGAASSTSTPSSSSPASSSTGVQSTGATSTNTAVTGQMAGSGAAGAPASSLGAIRGTQNRFGDRQPVPSASNQTGSSGSNRAASNSSALGSSGIGSTAANLIGAGGGFSRGGGGGGGGGGGQGGGSDFALVLVEVAKPGSQVKKGEVVAEFDRQYQLNRLDDYRATVAQLDANLKHMRADLADARQAHEQLVISSKAAWDKALLDLKTAEVRSAIEAEDLKLAAQESEARYKQVAEESRLVEASQRAQILASEIDRDQAKIELDRAIMNVDRMIVRAPMNGIVVMQSIWRGGDFGQVQQGDQIWPGMTFMQIVDPSSMVIMANVNQVDAETIRLGLKATARLDAYPGSEFPARVIGAGAITKPGAWRPTYMREIAIRMKLEQIDARVIPDLSASADILLAAERQATLAPLSAVFREDRTTPFVLLQTPSGWQRRTVTLGLENRVVVVVRSGLSPGDVVAAERPTSGKAPS